MAKPKFYQEAEIYDARDEESGHLFKTGEGAGFIDPKEAEFHQRQIASLSTENGRFLIDWKDEKGDIIETYFVDENGFELLVGSPPKTQAEYEQYDADYWENALEVFAKAKRQWA